MYKSLYHLESKPFESYPDPLFLWLGEKHKESLSVLRYGILDSMGFVLLTGDAGMGKTILMSSLTQELKSDVVWAVISDPGLSPKLIDFYNKIGKGFGLDEQFTSKIQFLIQFTHFLQKTYDADKKVVLFIDSCHLLTQDIFKGLETLSAIEKDDAKLIDIFFVGRPEFNDLLIKPENKAVRLCLGLQAKIVPFEPGETVNYIRHRLKISGGTEKIFTARAFRLIHQYSRGVPRAINMICEEALQAGFLRGKNILDHNLILECVQKQKLAVPSGLSDLNSPPVEKKEVENVLDKCAPRDIECQTITAGLAVRKTKRMVPVFCAISVLVCIGLAGYFFSLKKEIPVAVEVADTVASQDVGVAAVQFSPEIIETESVSGEAGREKKMLKTGKIILGLQPGTVKLTVAAVRIFSEFVEILLQYPDTLIVVKGFVSSKNNSQANIQLSRERAENVRQLLRKHGVMDTQIEVIGMGIQDPVATNDTPAGRLKNRRVEIEIIDDEV